MIREIENEEDERVFLRVVQPKSLVSPFIASLADAHEAVVAEREAAAEAAEKLANPEPETIITTATGKMKITANRPTSVDSENEGSHVPPDERKQQQSHKIAPVPLSKVLIQDVTPSADREASFKFVLLENAKFSGFGDKETQELLYKWGMRDHCYLKRFSYDQVLQAYQIKDFLLDFFNDPNSNPHLKVLGTMDRWGNLGKVRSVDFTTTHHTVTSLSFFDRLKTPTPTIPIVPVREDNSIRKCLDVYTDQGFVISDELRQCLLMPECESYDLFSSAERGEFIFHLFKALCLGGRLCQFEDSLDPYLEVTRKLYKDLITVARGDAGGLRVASLVYRIDGVKSEGSPLFPMDHPQNFCYVSIDPLRRHVNVFYHASDVYY
ncbi:hypothetical protein HK101_007114 [Irineochytrium annulatum]|nr:hypothetical protein HK101_007114 [Irineochytrium annulatum]